MDLLLRAGQERRIEGREWLLWQTVTRGPVKGLVTIEVDFLHSCLAKQHSDLPMDVRADEVTNTPPRQ